MSMALLNVNYFCAATDEQGLEDDTAENLTENATIIDSNQFFNETSENSTNTSTEDIDLILNETTDDKTSELLHN